MSPEGVHGAGNRRLFLPEVWIPSAASVQTLLNTLDECSSFDPLIVHLCVLQSLVQRSSVVKKSVNVAPFDEVNQKLHLPTLKSF